MRASIMLFFLLSWHVAVFAADDEEHGRGQSQVYEVVFEPIEARFFRFVAT